MSKLRDSNYVDPPTSVRSLAQLAGIMGTVSARQLMTLLGDRRFGPSPIYILGHNTNSIVEVKSALDGGANAVEVDVTAYEFDLSQLCIDHAGLTGDSPGSTKAPRFEDFLHGLRWVADVRPQLALVVFDCKPPAATPEHGRPMIDAIRRILTAGTELNIIISVGDVISSNPYRLNGTSVSEIFKLDVASTIGFQAAFCSCV
jgi:hypothetical protein